MAAQAEMIMPFGLSRDGKTRMLMNKDTAEELSAPVEAYRQSQDAPPWERCTLIVIGLVCCDGQGSLMSCFEHITTLFPLWHKAAIAALFGQTEDNYGRPYDRRRLLRPFEEAMFDYSIPIVMTNKIKWWPDDVFRKEAIFSITREAAIEYLRTTIVPPEHSLVSLLGRLLDLPAELRNRIYEYIFIFPSHGLRISKSWEHIPPWERTEKIREPRNQAVVTTRTRSLESAPLSSDMMSAWETEHKGPVKLCQDTAFLVGTLSSIVGPSWLGKQIWKEAMPIFYGQNHFHCNDLKELCDLLSKTRHFRKHFRSISVIYDWRHRDLGSKALESLGLAPNLEHIMILFFDRLTVDRIEEDYKGISGLCATLARMKSLKSVKICSPLDVKKGGRSCKGYSDLRKVRLTI